MKFYREILSFFLHNKQYLFIKKIVHVKLKK